MGLVGCCTCSAEQHRLRWHSRSTMSSGNLRVPPLFTSPQQALRRSHVLLYRAAAGTERPASAIHSLSGSKLRRNTIYRNLQGQRNLTDDFDRLVTVWESHV